METALDQLALWDLVTRRVDLTADAVLAVDESDATITFAEYRRRCERVAAALADVGVGPGAPVAWMLPTWIEALVLAGALARLGAVQVPLLPILREREMDFIVRQSGAAHLVVPGVWRGVDYPALAASVTAGIANGTTNGTTNGIANGIANGIEGADERVVGITIVDRMLPEADPDLLPQWDAIRPAPGDDPRRWIFYTSGTTAHPKGTLHSDRTVAAAALRLNRRFEMTEHDRNALVFPVTHIGGISWLMGGLMAGYRQILVEAFDPPTACAVLRRNGVTIAGSGPAFWMAYVAEQRHEPEVDAFPRLRALVGGGAAKPPTLNDEVREVLGVPLVTGYGSSECPGVADCGVWDTEATRKSDGYPLDDSAIRIAGPDGALVPVGEIGEIECTGPMLFKGYLDPAENDGAFTADGWFRTGDLGMLDEHGLLRVTGRVKDIIIRKGENISAKEVEDVLYLHPAVHDVAAVPLPDRERGELCCAVIVLTDGSEPLSLDDVIAHCTEHRLARQKVPERIEIVDTLPRNATGKVLKQDLVDRFGAP